MTDYFVPNTDTAQPDDSFQCRECGRSVFIKEGQPSCVQCGHPVAEVTPPQPDNPES
jgi:hypothetical protein